jgi:hypothetical protein
MDRFQQRVASETAPCEVHLLDRQVEMTALARDRHFWSPYLNVLLEEQNGYTTLRGRFGPNINVWTMFLAAYAVLFILGGVGLVIGTSQLQIDQPPTGLWLSAGCICLAALTWVAGKVGQRWAYDQMVLIHLFVHELFDDVIADDIFCEACDNKPISPPKSDK